MKGFRTLILKFTSYTYISLYTIKNSDTERIRVHIFKQCTLAILSEVIKGLRGTPLRSGSPSGRLYQDYTISMSFPILRIVVGYSIVSTQEYRSRVYEDISLVPMVLPSSRNPTGVQSTRRIPHGHAIIDE
jgi:hypothetical protein